ncbi:MAG: hypothetical protein NTW56_03285 [Alphaproteobacteria bacterium]|nr:hypothetical protein [Alphaproteobacteria bacterium]
MRILLLLLALTAPAMAQRAETLTLPGEARTGTDQRQVRFTFLCSANAGPQVTGVLAVDLAVSRHDTLRPVFNFDAYEGPDANAGRRTGLEVAGQGAAVRMQSMVSGSIGEGDAFVFNLAAARRRDAARLAELSRLLTPLTQGAAQLEWTQGNTRPGGPAITARLAVSAADAARLRTVLEPCLAP